MARYSAAYSNFLERLTEVELLRKQAVILERKNPIQSGKNINALCRGSVLLISSHVEAYIKELGEHALHCIVTKNVCRSKFDERFFYYISKDIIDEIEKINDPSKVAKKIFAFIDRDVDHWKRIDDFPTPINSVLFNKGFSNPKFIKIKAYLGRFGYIKYKSDMFLHLRANGQPVINMIDQLVDLRNLIAHGDFTATKTPSDILEILKMVKIFCRTTDDCFCSWFKTSFCTLR